MFCPHCHNKIPDGSNICPLCYADLTGVKPQQAGSASDAMDHADEEREYAPPTRKKKTAAHSAYTKGSRGGKKSADRTPMIVAFGLIVILVIIIVMIIRSMFSAGAPVVISNTPMPQATQEVNFLVFGATATPAQIVVTPTPAIEVTPTPSPEPSLSYNTLRKGDQGPEVITLQQALVELGYLSGATDGNFGTGTQTAVKKFQADHGLDSDGIAGKMTLEKLYSMASVTPIPEVTAGPGDIMDLPG